VTNLIDYNGDATLNFNNGVPQAAVPASRSTRGINTT
jgi:hypothetical protein